MKSWIMALSGWPRLRRRSRWPELKDLRLSVKCKPVAGKGDQGCGKVASGVWHELAVEMTLDHIRVFFDGKQVIDDHDGTFKDAGKFGVWTKADSIVHFGDLTATPK